MSEPETKKPLMHTFEQDMSKAMDATDAKVVQEILERGREKEFTEKENYTRRKQKAWYKLGATVFIICALISSGYAFYHYKNLTVTAEKPISIGVFPSTEAITTNSSDIRKTIETIRNEADLEQNKPYLVPLVESAESPALLNVNQIFSFFESGASEPFVTSFSIVRLGVMNDGVENIPFVIAGVKDPEITNKELLIAEKSLLQYFYKSLNIDLSLHKEEVGKGFVSEFLYNVPIKSLKYKDPSGAEKNLFFYARVTDNVVVFTTSPNVLKSIYDSLIRQGL
ncbi:MAG TPA: hypothetical protein PLQ20_00175 [Candidatus Paceibacterota bacterium]|nr:hypothetical protein [Candidatus Paceibacterota bacterium]